MKVVMIGTGNVAFVISKLLVAAGHTIVQVYGRNEMALAQLAALSGAEAIHQFSTLRAEADVCIIAVADAAIESIAKSIPAKDMLVAHTSGATSINCLRHFKNYGVLYPLQSLRKEMPYVPAIPFFIDANTNDNEKILTALASSSGNTVSVARDEQRLQLHTAAVFCANFTNHLYGLTEAFCKQEQIEMGSLFPLIQETANRLQFLPASQTQTGPAVRNDTETMHRHLQLLASSPHLSGVYRFLSQSIQQFGKTNA